jgi:hypothetical protein
MCMSKGSLSRRRHGGTLDGGGYWLVTSDGGVLRHGDAGFYRSVEAAP